MCLRQANEIFIILYKYDMKYMRQKAEGAGRG
jgi:hypothetical protein